MAIHTENIFLDTSEMIAQINNEYSLEFRSDFAVSLCRQQAGRRMPTFNNFNELSAWNDKKANPLMKAKISSEISSFMHSAISGADAVCHFDGDIKFVFVHHNQQVRHKSTESSSIAWHKLNILTEIIK